MSLVHGDQFIGSYGETYKARSASLPDIKTTNLMNFPFMYSNIPAALSYVSVYTIFLSLWFLSCFFFWNCSHGTVCFVFGAVLMVWYVLFLELFSWYGMLCFWNCFHGMVCFVFGGVLMVKYIFCFWSCSHCMVCFVFGAVLMVWYVLILELFSWYGMFCF